MLLYLACEQERLMYEQTARDTLKPIAGNVLRGLVYELKADPTEARRLRLLGAIEGLHLLGVLSAPGATEWGYEVERTWRAYGPVSGEASGEEGTLAHAEPYGQ